MTNLVRSSALKCYCPHHGWKISVKFRSRDIPWRFQLDVAVLNALEALALKVAETWDATGWTPQLCPQNFARFLPNSVSTAFSCDIPQRIVVSSSSTGPITAVTAHTASFDPVFAEFVPGDSSKLHKAAQISNSLKVDSWRFMLRSLVSSEFQIWLSSLLTLLTRLGQMFNWFSVDLSSSPSKSCHFSELDSWTLSFGSRSTKITKPAETSTCSECSMARCHKVP